MKKSTLFAGGLLLSALACAPAMAEVVRVKITARVSSLVDPSGQLNGKVVLGQRLSGTYVYNTNTPDAYSSPDQGFYQPYANEARVRLVAGGWVFESQPATQGIFIEINANVPWGNGYFDYSSQENKPLSNGVGVESIRVSYFGGGFPTDALPTAAPTLSDYFQKEVAIYGASPSGNGFQVIANVESAELVTTDTVQVSPAAGSFLPLQHFDAALTLPRNSNVVNVTAKANGVTLLTGFPAHCTLLPPPTSASGPSVLCQDANELLPQAAGAPIEWTVELSNGSLLTETVNWTLQQ